MNIQAKASVSRRQFLKTSVAATALCSAPGVASAQQSLNLLAWIGYQEADLVRPFEQQHGVRLNVKTYVGGDQMFSLFMASKGVYDVVLMDPEYVQKLQPLGRLTPLDPADYDVSTYLPLFKRYPPVWIDNKMWALMVRYGFNGLVYNTNKVSEEAARSYKVVWDPAMKGRVGIWDWYLPSMGSLSRYLGHKNPYALTEAEFGKLVESLFSLKPSVGAIFPDFSTMLASFASEQIWIVPAGGDWVGAALKHQGHPVAWSIPEEGGIIWSECLTIPTDSRNPELAKKYIQYMASGRAQALLTWRKANTSQIPNMDGWRYMTDKQKAALQITTEQAAVALLSRAFIRQLPSSPPEARWQEAWQRFKARA